MKTQNLVVVHELYPALVEALSDAFNLTHFTRLVDDQDRAAFEEAMAQADAYLGSNVAFTEALLDKAPRLRVVASVSVGVDSYPIEAMRERGIVLTNTPDVLTESTADTGFLLLMMAARRAGEMLRKVRGHEWTASLSREDFGVDVHGKTLGIVGLGRIGQAVARRGHDGFGMSVNYTNRSAKPEVEDALEARRVDLETLFRESDFICVTVPLSAETEGLIGREHFALTRPHAVFVNISRGKVVREDELVACLQDGTLHCAGLDVYEREPLSTASPLMTLDNAVCLPHIGSSTFQTRNAMCDLAVDNVKRVLAGEGAITAV
ncbi:MULTISPECIES: 2-hydroxyacid dehydrogenase [Halomonas]|uniref:Bifunctional glyoxylate/hydroxypyruvate reductase B n=1 Tax=Halomonas halophila TaxID=29573 RepID=A0ABQ0U2Y0_9GAMM|nr:MULTISPECIES: D-glycerate dehydrogenase [Halomonas]MDR5890177.1 D-glycerate dehydrogenase [Halomonas salina]RAH37960.1 D-glycerate dehydrogenase [Halomonas sp. SL1]WJY06563.1 D-glycerate dehydrogenase [Halomonas halophila]GEK72750.1 bifunctional glyoxylate/hydroxypyruvate reductase B [Halomonas halophila]